MLNLHDLISGGMIGVPLMILAALLLVASFYRDTHGSQKQKHPHNKVD
jgi:hypothetical protein